jgi:protein-tyrosine-phosphatase
MSTVTFVCFGNLCRSPFAEKYAIEQAAAHGLAALRFDSAGIGAVAGQVCPKPAIVAARELAVDLTAHLAKHIEEISFDAGDRVIAMDRFVFGSLASNLGVPLSEVRGPNGSHLELMMHSLAGDPETSPLGLDIPDPMGGGVPAYRDCYRLLARAVDRLLARIAAGPDAGSVA